MGLSLYSRERPIWSFACSPAADAAVMCGLKSLVLLGAADGGRYPSLPPSLSRTFCDKDTHSLAHILSTYSADLQICASLYFCSGTVLVLSYRCRGRQKKGCFFPFCLLACHRAAHFTYNVITEITLIMKHVNKSHNPA